MTACQCRALRGAGLLLAALTLIAPLPAQAQDADLEDPAEVMRLAGPERISTAVAISGQLAEDRPEAVLARADQFPDALAATQLATAVEGPLLLTGGDGLAQVTAEELVRIMSPGGTVFLAGGTDALGRRVADDVEALGFIVQRVDGETRYETAVGLARLSRPQPTRIYLADGNTFPDAMIAGHTAARDDFATMLLTDGARLPDVTKSYLDDFPEVEVVAVGPVAASIAIADRVVVGADVYETSALLADLVPSRGYRAALASGEDFPDGLAGGTHAALLGLTLLLVTPEELPPSVADHLASHPTDELTVYGGTDAVSTRVTNTAAAFADANGLVTVDGLPIDAYACDTDADTVLRWSAGQVTVQRNPGTGTVTTMAIDVNRRMASTTEVIRVASGADDVDAFRGTFDPQQTDGVEVVRVEYNVGLGLCG